MSYISVFYLFIALNNATAEMPVVDNFDEVSVNTFWNELYPNGGWSLYCGYRFDRASELTEGSQFVIEHIYPVSWMLKHLQCQSRRQCRRDRNPVFTRMEADLHNLYPVWQDINVSRRETPFGMVAGEDWRFEGCDFERYLGVTEPRPIARGNIARSLFYMHRQYGLPLNGKMLSVLKQWNREDPPSKQEQLRNRLIEELQGNRNPYIDDPAQAEKLATVVTEN